MGEDSVKSGGLKAALSATPYVDIPKIITILSELSATADVSDDCAEQLSLIGLAEASFSPHDEMYGVSSHYFRNLCNVRENDIGLLFECLTHIPSSSIVHEVLLLLVWSLSTDSEVCRFVDAIHLLSCSNDSKDRRIVALAVRAAVDALEGRGGQSCNVLHRIVTAAHERGEYTLELMVAGLIVYELRGDDRPAENGYHGMIVAELEFLKGLIAEDGEHIGKNEISFVFGLKSEDADDSRYFRESGLSTIGRSAKYAQALVVCTLIDLKIADEVRRVLVKGAFAISDTMPFYWKQGNQYVLPACVGRGIAYDNAPIDTWREFRTFCGQLLWRDLRMGGTHSRYNTALLSDAYIRSAVSAIELLLQQQKTVEARLVWQDAWNDCLSELWNRMLPGSPVDVIQYLFVYKALYLEEHNVSAALIELVKMLPIIESRSLKPLRCADLCLSALGRNLSDEQRSMFTPEFLALVNEAVANVQTSDQR